MFQESLKFEFLKGSRIAYPNGHASFSNIRSLFYKHSVWNILDQTFLGYHPIVWVANIA